jgi:hypothetical protein
MLYDLGSLSASNGLLVKNTLKGYCRPSAARKLPCLNSAVNACYRCNAEVKAKILRPPSNGWQ